MVITSRFNFEAEHSLPSDAEPHFHLYELEVDIQGDPDLSGTIVDHDTFRRLVVEDVLKNFDTKNLNRVLYSPTLEFIAREIKKQINECWYAKKLQGFVSAIRLYMDDFSVTV